MFRKRDQSSLERAVERALKELEDKDVGSAEYAKIVETVEKLHKMKVEETPDSVSMDTAAAIAANLLGIMLIIRHEHVNVITSRAMNLVMKPK